MINKSHIWFLTLTSIILVLAVYYIAIPQETLKSVFNTNKGNSIVTTKIEESEVLTALRVSKEEELLKTITSLQETLLSASATIDEKNEAYETIKYLNTNSSIEEKLEKTINEKFNVTSFVQIKDTTIKVTVASKKDNVNLANSIIRTVNESVEEDYYITVKFE